MLLSKILPQIFITNHHTKRNYSLPPHQHLFEKFFVTVETGTSKQWCQTNPNWFVAPMDFKPHTENQLHYWDIRLSGFLQSYLLGASWVITHDLEFCQLWNLGWQVNYYSDFRFKLFFNKKIQSAGFYDAFCPNNVTSRKKSGKNNQRFLNKMLN